MDTMSKEVDILILGAGWTAQFLLPLLASEKISHATTTTTGRNGTIPFVFNADGKSDTVDSEAAFQVLPRSKTVLITLPLKNAGQAKRLTSLYWKTHAAMQTNWIQLGSTGIFSGVGWNDCHGEYDRANARAVAEDELMASGGCVLNLAGLYGGAREPKNWVGRVASTKTQLKAKGALHLIHGEDVARAVLAMHRRFVGGERWIVTDRHVYDWWDLVDGWADELESLPNTTPTTTTEKPQYRRWVQECMEEDDVAALPRSPQQLGRVLDSRAFWKEMGILPARPKLS